MKKNIDDTVTIYFIIVSFADPLSLSQPYVLFEKKPIKFLDRRKFSVSFYCISNNFSEISGSTDEIMIS